MSSPPALLETFHTSTVLWVYAVHLEKSVVSCWKLIQKVCRTPDCIKQYDLLSLWCSALVQQVHWVNALQRECRLIIDENCVPRSVECMPKLPLRTAVMRSHLACSSLTERLRKYVSKYVLAMSEECRICGTLREVHRGWKGLTEVVSLEECWVGSWRIPNFTSWCKIFAKHW